MGKRLLQRVQFQRQQMIEARNASRDGSEGLLEGRLPDSPERGFIDEHQIEPVPPFRLSELRKRPGFLKDDQSGRREPLTPGVPVRTTREEIDVECRANMAMRADRVSADNEKPQFRRPLSGLDEILKVHAAAWYGNRRALSVRIRREWRTSTNLPIDSTAKAY